MINMCNNRHVMDVMFEVHNPTEFINRELYLQILGKLPHKKTLTTTLETDFRKNLKLPL